MFSKLDNICHQDLLIVARFMIACDQCGSWFHGSCMGINEDMATSMETSAIRYIVLLYGMVSVLHDGIKRPF